MKNKALANVLSLGTLQIFNYILPLFAVPFLLFKLGAQNNGFIITTQLLLSYLSLIIEYGFVLTASKQAATINSTKELSYLFSSVFFTKTILLIITSIFWISLVFIVDIVEIKICLLIGYFQVVGLFLNPVWLFQGKESSHLLTKANVVIRTIFYIILFIVISFEPNLYIALFLLTFPFFLIGLYCFIKAIKIFEISLIFVNKNAILKELKDGFYGFWITLMNFTYTASGTLFLGIFTTQEIVGIYGTLEKIVRAGLQFVNPIVHGLYPKVLRTLNEEKWTQLRNMLLMCFLLSLILGAALFIFSPLINEIFISEFSSSHYIRILHVLSLWFIFSSINLFIGIWIFFGTTRMVIYTKIYTLSTVICLVLHVCLIPIYGESIVPFNLLFGELIMFGFFIKKIREEFKNEFLQDATVKIRKKSV